MRTLGVKSNHMLKNVIGHKMNHKINTIGNKMISHAIENKFMFHQPSPEIYTANENMNNLIHMSHGLKNLNIGHKKNLYEKKRKK